MIIGPDKSIEILSSTPAVLKEQLEGLSREWLFVRESKDSWNPAEIVCHLIHCEKDDWLPRIKIILSDAARKEFRPFNRTEGFEKSESQTINELLTEFSILRKENLEYLKSLPLDNEHLNNTGIHPEFGEVTLKQLLSTWVVHDLSHIVQINRILAKQYADEVGPWISYLQILKK